jgi:chromosome segregation ATPase
VLVVIGCLVVKAYQDQPNVHTQPPGDKIKNLRSAIEEKKGQRDELEEEIKGLEREYRTLVSQVLTEQLRDRKKELNTKMEKLRKQKDPLSVAALDGDINYTTDVIRKIQDRLLALSDARPATSPNLAGSDSSRVGRFQFYQKERDVPHIHGLLLDTTNGHCWLLDGMEWKDLGMPNKREIPAALQHERTPTLAPPQEPPDRPTRQ